MADTISTILAATTGEYSVSGLRGSSHAWFSSLLAGRETICCIVADEQLVPALEEDLKLFSTVDVLVYPGYEIPPYTPLSPDQRTTAARISTLYALQERTTPNIVVTSIEALMRRVIPRNLLSGRAELIVVGEEIDRHDLITTLISSGYEQVALVRSAGDFSVKGGIVDIFPPPFRLEDKSFHSGPLRLDFFGDTLESLRSFDIFSQRSQAELTEAVLLPVTDTLFPKKESCCSLSTLQHFDDRATRLAWNEESAADIYQRLKNIGRFAGVEFFLPLFYQDNQRSTDTVFDYLPEKSTLVLIDPAACMKTVELVNERILSNYKEAQNTGFPALPPPDLFLDQQEVEAGISHFKRIRLTDFDNESTIFLSVKTTSHQLLKQNIELQRRQRGLLASLTDQILIWQQEQERVIVCCRSSRHAGNLAELLHKRGHIVVEVNSPLAFENLVNHDHIYLCDHPLHQGFSLPDHKLHILSESELFGEMRLGSKAKKRRQADDLLQFAELSEGDVVVHSDHGLGIYKGLATIEFHGAKNDFMLIEYRDGDKLYLPVDRMHLVSRYEGLSDREPRIDKLGTQSWKSVKAKVKEEVWKVAQELLEIYAQREVRQGRRFSPPTELYHELEESFPYDETPGQNRAISEVIEDLTSDKPMDRLICGDVGYGKTEVAIRAAFKVVEDGCQVAVLVPTTVLAEQHLTTFRERLQGFPVTVDCLNRFRTPAEQRRITKDLAGGKIDIIIGTHRLLSRDVVYRNLGLLVVDEEHRFGVTHKEKIKKIKAEVDILTLTATPIPRTLQMSLLSIRDLSVISSPPEHRQPVKTFVARYDDLVIKEAIMKEMRRKGQVFFVHNRVKSIHKMAAKVQKLVPNIRIAVAHGQMAGKELEAIMVAFVNKEIDVLCSTTIIESGLDIPAANTIIINRADLLGLAEIYQLRGRVGRSSLQSFAYLLVPSIDTLSRESKERLRALMDYNELGGGFKLAMSDLQIRGGGNLLGVSQSGHIAAIGYDLYLDLLQKTVADLKNLAANSMPSSPHEDDLDPEIHLHISAYIPEEYIPDISQRYIAYRRISALTRAENEEAADLMEELSDRYGRLPQETTNLFQIVAVKKTLCLLRVSKLERGANSLVFSFVDNTPLQPQQLLDYIGKRAVREKTSPSRLVPDGRLIISTVNAKEKDIFTVLEQTLTDLLKLTDGHH